jgi:outer membrane protein assembly factor BamD (BamD/ComL family)
MAASQPSRLAEERQLITMARVALGRGDHESARKALREHGRAHPAGQLAEEREALVVLTLIRLGQVPRAREVAVRFRRSYPQSLLLPTIEAALAQARP